LTAPIVKDPQRYKVSPRRLASAHASVA
jgi:hypothetical protein